MLHELHLALRSLRHSPGFVLTAIVSLALGIGANTAVFSLFHQVLLRSLLVPHPDRLVLFHTDGQDPGWAMADNFETVYSYPTYKEFRDRSQVFDGIAARSGASATVMEPAGAANARVELVSGNFFVVLGVRAAVGRTILPADDTAPGANPVVLLSYGYWSRSFGSDPKALNSRLLINKHPMTVIGVLDRRFLGVQSGQMPDLYVPLSMKQQISPGWDGFGDVSGRWLNLIARIKPGISNDTAQAATRVLFRAIRDEDLPKIRPMQPRERDEYLHRTVGLRPAARGINMLSEFWRTPLSVLMAMVGLVLLICCLNLASLLAARAAARQREMAVRMALGARGPAILRQLLVESLTLTITAGLMGFLFAKWAVSGLLRLINNNGNPGWVTADLDLSLLAYTLAVAALVGLLFGCAPLLQVMKIDLAPALREHSGATASSARQRARRTLVAVQIALALVLLIGAGLFVRTLTNLKRASPGFQAANLLTFALEPRLNGYNPSQAALLLRNIRERLMAVHGVETVAFAGLGPFGRGSSGGSLYVEGYPAAPDEEPGASNDSVSAGYFRALQIPMVAGREFDERDNATSTRVVIISDALAGKYFHGRNPLGMHIGPDKKMEYQVIGVARDTHWGSLRDTPDPFLFYSLEQRPPDRSIVYIRGYGSDLASVARATVREIDPNLPVMDMQTMQSRLDESMFIERSIAALAAAFGVLATVLAAVGLYGVIAYSIARRSCEFGIRMALGATRSDVCRSVLNEAAALLLAGAAMGLPIALALGRLIESQLFGIRSYDPILIGTAVGILALVAFAGALFPSRRAASIDPVRALHSE